MRESSGNLKNGWVGKVIRQAILLNFNYHSKIPFLRQSSFNYEQTGSGVLSNGNQLLIRTEQLLLNNIQILSPIVIQSTIDIQSGYFSSV